MESVNSSSEERAGITMGGVKLGIEIFFGFVVGALLLIWGIRAIRFLATVLRNGFGWMYRAVLAKIFAWIGKHSIRIAITAIILWLIPSTIIDIRHFLEPWKLTVLLLAGCYWWWIIREAIRRSRN